MRRQSVLLVFTLSVVAATPAFAVEPDGAVLSQYANFCQGTYALCIKAPCSAVVSHENGEYAITGASCVCDVLTGWSMGPGACDERQPVTQNGRTYLISTYSNFFNKTNLTLTCSSDQNVWAWCYGAPCVIDPKDPSKAVCTCPVRTGPAKTLGGACRQDSCNSLWSAASYAEDWFANNYFAYYAKKNDLQPPANPAALDCPTN